MTKTRLIIGASVLLLAVLIAVGVWGALKAMRVLEMARELKAEVGALKAEMSAVRRPEDIPAALETGRAALVDIEAQFAELQREVEPFRPILLRLGWVPVYGDDLAAVPHLLDVIEALLQTAHHLDAGLTPLADLIAGGFTGPEMFAPIAAAAEQAQPHLAQAGQAFAEARAAREAIGEVDGLLPELRDAVDDADEALILVDRGLTAAQTYLPPLSPLLGMQAPHRVLVLVQNADELRPTGGWITATAYVTIEQGRVTHVEVLNSHDLTIDRFGQLAYGEPPAPLRDYMHLPIWVFRDSNWSPDFPTAATRALALYTSARRVPVDTVVAIDQYTLRDLLASAGPVTLSDIESIDQDNLIAFLQQSWAESYKDILPELTPLLIQKLLDVRSARDVMRRWEAVEEITARNDLLVYSTNPAIQALAETLGWDGAIPAAPGDYVYPVEANISYNKVNLNISRTMSYHISLANPAEPYAMLNIEYANRSQGEPGTCWDRSPSPQRAYVYRAHDCYGNYLRLYLPQGAQMVNPPRFPIPPSYLYVDDPAAGQFGKLPDEQGKEVYGGLIVVPIGRSVTAPFTYRLDPEQIFTLRPDGALVYRLLVQKQPGVRPYPLFVTIDLPGGAEVLEISPEPVYADGGTIYFEQVQGTDFEVQVVMRVPGTPDGLPLEATPAATPTPRILPTLAPLPVVPPTLTPQPTPAP